MLFQQENSIHMLAMDLHKHSRRLCSRSAGGCLDPQQQQCTRKLYEVQGACAVLAQPVTLRTEPQASRAYLQMTTNFTVSSSPLLSALSDTSRGYSASKCRLMTSWLTTLLASSERFIPPIQNCRNIVDGVRRSSHFAEPITSTFSISLGTRWFLSHIGSWQRRHNHAPARSNKQNWVTFAQIVG